MTKLLLHTETVIDSAHYLVGYDGLCKNTHGHSWKLDVWIKGELHLLSEIGILFDFGNIKKIKEKYDHKLINTIPPFDKINPTAENLVIKIYEDLKSEDSELEFCLRLYETKIGKETWVEYGDFNI